MGYVEGQRGHAEIEQMVNAAYDAAKYLCTKLKENKRFRLVEPDQRQDQYKSFSEEWGKILSVVLNLLNQRDVSKFEWQDLFFSVHSICSWIEQGAEKIHQELEKEIIKYVELADKRIRMHHEENALLRAYISEWQKFFAQAHYLPMPFNILENSLGGRSPQLLRAYPRTGTQSREPDSMVKRTMLDMWNKTIFSGIKDKLQTAAMKLVAAERNGEAFDSQLVVKVRESYVSLCTDVDDQLSIYRSHFEKAYLDATEEFYKSRASQILESNGVQSYMQYADMKLREEEQRGQRYLDSNKTDSMEKLVERCVDVLVVSFQEQLLAECPKLIKANEIEKLQMMFRLLNRTPNGIPPMLKYLDEHIRCEGLSDMIQNAKNITTDPEKYVEQLLTMFHRFSDLVRDAFYDDPRFLTARDKAFQEILNDTTVFKLELTHNKQKGYLQEIGYSETILDVRSFRVRSLLGLGGNQDGRSGSENESGIPRSVTEKALMESERSVLATMDFLGTSESGKESQNVQDEEEGDSDSDDDTTVLEASKHKTAKRKDDGLGAEEAEVLGEFDFLAGDAAQQAIHGKRQTDQWGIDEEVLNRMKDQYRLEAKHKKAKHDSMSKHDDISAMFSGHFNAKYDTNTNATGQNLAEIEPASKDVTQPDLSGMYIGDGAVDIDGALGLTSSDERDDIADEFGLGDDEGALPKKWNLRYTLRNHFDAIRAMQFHPVEPLLCTASEDGTVKLWNLAKSGEDGKTAVSDLEPVYTFRGHRGAVLSLHMSPTGDMCYTGGLDGTVRCWSLPSPNIDVYDKFDPKVLVETLQGHGDAVWSVAFHTSDNRLISASADATLKLWEPGSPEPLLKTYGPPSRDMIPTCVDFVSTEPQQVLAAYSPGSASILDLETGRTVLGFDCSCEDGSVGRVSCIASHPTMPVTITAGEDRRIRYFDNNSGQLIQGTVAHVEAISSLALDPNGLYLLSGSHDGSLRLWNMEKRVCLQEIAAHRKKYDESVLTVAFHPSRPLIGSAGADALAKIYG